MSQAGHECVSAWEHTCGWFFPAIVYFSAPSCKIAGETWAAPLRKASHVSLEKEASSPKLPFVVHCVCYAALDCVNYWSASGRFELVTHQRHSEAPVCCATIFLCCLLGFQVAEGSSLAWGWADRRPGQLKQRQRNGGRLVFQQSSTAKFKAHEEIKFGCCSSSKGKVDLEKERTCGMRGSCWIPSSATMKFPTCHGLQGVVCRLGNRHGSDSRKGSLAWVLGKQKGSRGHSFS